jgi:hypothetical protein
VRFGFGLCEGSAMVLHGSERAIEAIGARGVLVLELDPQQVRLAPENADPRGIRMYLLEPGQRASLDNLAADTAARSETGAALLQRTLRDLAEDYQRAAAESDSDSAAAMPRWEALLPPTTGVRT